jgi:hypothetical protein
VCVFMCMYACMHVCMYVCMYVPTCMSVYISAHYIMVGVISIIKWLLSEDACCIVLSFVCGCVFILCVSLLVL